MQSSTFLFENLTTLQKSVSLSTESERQLIEISWNTPLLEIPLNVSVTFSYEDTREEFSRYSSPAADQVGILKFEDGPLKRDFHHNVTFSMCPMLIGSRFDLPSEIITPRMSWSRRESIKRARFSMNGSDELKAPPSHARLEVISEVMYFDAESCLLIATEREIRVKVLEGERQKELTDLLKACSHLPCLTPYWMAEYYFKRLKRLPTHQDLIGYEYEAKLKVDHLNCVHLPQTLLPHFEIIERYQTESVRWYYTNVTFPGMNKMKKARVGFRGTRASLVRKGKKQKLDGGILKRSEEKAFGLNTWELSLASGELKEMRRIKRQLYILSHPTRRVYALCLDYCYVEGPRQPPLLQVELEYNGRLLIHPAEWSLSIEQQLELAEQFQVSHPKVALRCLERTQWLIDHEPDTNQTLKTRYQHLRERCTPDVLSAQELSAQEPSAQGVLEAEVLSEMRILLEALKDEFGYQVTHQTKHEWLKESAKTDRVG